MANPPIIVPEHTLPLNATFTQLEVPRKDDLEGPTTSRSETVGMRNAGSLDNDSKGKRIVSSVYSFFFDCSA